MAFEPLIKDEPDQPEVPAPDPVAQLGETLNANLAAMREQINAAYQQNKGIQPPAPQVQYVPYPVNQPAEESYNEADILADLPGALDRVRQQAAQEVEERLRGELGQHLTAVYEKDFERDLKDMAQTPYYKFVEEDLKAHFAANPNEKYLPGRLQEKYNALVGQKLPEIREAEQKEAEANQPARVRTVEHSIPVSSSPTPASFETGKEEEPELTEREEAMRQHANKFYGTNISKKEWAADQQGELFPTDFDEDMRVVI